MESKLNSQNSVIGNMNFAQLDKWVSERVDKFMVYLDFRLTYKAIDFQFPNTHQRNITPFEKFIIPDPAKQTNSYNRWTAVIERRKYWAK